MTTRTDPLDFASAHGDLLIAYRHDHRARVRLVGVAHRARPVWSWFGAYCHTPPPKDADGRIVVSARFVAADYPRCRRCRWDV